MFTSNKFNSNNDKKVKIFVLDVQKLVSESPQLSL